jgi:hypothetical protein
MKEHRINKAITTVLFLLIALAGKTQSTTTVRASVDKTNILIGEQINFVIEANIPENEPIGFFSPDSIAHFEFIQKGKIDTANTNKGTILKQLFRITSFDSGQWVIPSYTLPQSSNLKTDSIVITVGYLPMDSTRDYNDIKEIIEVNVARKQDWTWYYAGGGILLLLLIIYLLSKKKKKAAVESAAAAEQVTDPYILALEQLDKLQKDSQAAKRKNIHSLQQTTDDLVTQLRDIRLEKEQYNQLSQSLRLSDFVKFAKYIPTEADNKNAFDTVKNAIQSIEKMNPATDNQ